MAPEQIGGRPRPASDQYALAAVIYEWLSGDRMFHGSFSEVCAQHMFSPPPPLRGKVPSIPPPVEQVILTALAKDPAQRFKSVRAFANALEQASRRDQPDAAIGAIKEVSPPSPLPNPAQASSSSAVPLTAPTSERPQAPAEAESPSPGEAQAPGTEAGGATLARRPKQLWRRWGIGNKQVIAVVCGALLYGLLNYPLNSLYQQGNPFVTNSLSVFNESIPAGIALADITLVIPLLLGATFGPWVGLLTVLGGSFLGASFAGYNAALDYYGASWTWNVGRPLIGFIAGLVFLKTQGRYPTAAAAAMAVLAGALGIVLGTAFSTYGDIWVSGVTPDAAWSNFLILALPTSIVLVAFPFLLFASGRIGERMRGQRDARN
jgi:hypothetical protein